ncbi:MAG: CBS domain-containing protein, partial [Conexivisphaera sp.]
VNLGGTPVWIWVAFEPNLRAMLGFHASWRGNSIDAYLFIRRPVRRYGRGRVTIYTDGAGWYADACRWANVEHVVYDRPLRNPMERINRYLKDRTESFDGLHPARGRRSSFERVLELALRVQVPPQLRAGEHGPGEGAAGVESASMAGGIRVRQDPGLDSLPGLGGDGAWACDLKLTEPFGVPKRLKGIGCTIRIVASKSPGSSWIREILSRRVEELADGDPLVVEELSPVRDVTAAMRQRAVCSAIVKFRDGSLGIVTERDVLYKVVASGLDPNTTPVGRVASRPLESVKVGTTVEEALARMASRGIRRLGVIGEDGGFRGLLTLEVLLGPGGSALLPVPRIPKGYICPFCGSQFLSKEELSKHIDRVHIGLGLLEGNVTKW